MSAAASDVYLSSKGDLDRVSSEGAADGEGCFRPLLIWQRHLLWSAAGQPQRLGR